MAMLGDCIIGRHGEKCDQKFERWYMGPVGTGRKKKNGVIMTGEFIECDCICHRKKED
jgi:hypothetical protein